jgi:hypothetical protein
LEETAGFSVSEKGELWIHSNNYEAGILLFSLINDHSSGVFPSFQVFKTGIDFLQAVPVRDQLLQMNPSGFIKLKQSGEIDTGIPGAIIAA